MYIKKSRLIIGAILLIIITAYATVALVNPFGFDHLSDFIKFTGVSKLIQAMYYEDMDGEEAANMAIAGVAAATGDPYTGYMWGNAATQYIEDVSGDYCGVGLYIEYDMEENLISVVSAIAGGPAEAAGIGTGDKILKLDGQIYKGEELSDAASYMRGEEGTEVVLTIRSAVTGEEKDVPITRERIKIVSVTGQMLDSQIGVIGISQFTEDVSQAFREKYDELKDAGMTSLIIDLRNNPGGIFEEAINIAGMFVAEGETITYTLDKSGNKEEYRATVIEGREAELDMPLVILMNEGSASASEVLSGALKAYNRATLMGEKSYGKGVVQSVLELDGSVMSVTVARYYAPNGVCIHGEGVYPDVEVDMPDELSASLSKLKIEDDIQVLAAIDYLRK